MNSIGKGKKKKRGEEKDSNTDCCRLTEVLQTSLFGHNLNGQRHILDFYLIILNAGIYLCTQLRHLCKVQNQPVCTDAPPKQLSHPSRKSNYIIPTRFETLGQHPALGTRAYTAARLIFRHPPPSPPGLANSKALQPSPPTAATNTTTVPTEPKQPSGWAGKETNTPA